MFESVGELRDRRVQLRVQRGELLGDGGRLRRAHTALSEDCGDAGAHVVRAAHVRLESAVDVSPSRLVPAFQQHIDLIVHANR